MALCHYDMAVQDGKLREQWTPGANVSLHALARRIERGADRSHAALTRDIAVLVDAGVEGERVDTAAGFWLGGVIDAMDGYRPIKLRHVRTWIGN